MIQPAALAKTWPINSSSLTEASEAGGHTSLWFSGQDDKHSETYTIMTILVNPLKPLN
jgi:hypothetical protein